MHSSLASAMSENITAIIHLGGCAIRKPVGIQDINQVIIHK